MATQSDRIVKIKILSHRTGDYKYHPADPISHPFWPTNNYNYNDLYYYYYYY